MTDPGGAASLRTALATALAAAERVRASAIENGGRLTPGAILDAQTVINAIEAAQEAPARPWEKKKRHPTPNPLDAVLLAEAAQEAPAPEGLRLSADLHEAIDGLESVSVGWAPGHTAPFVSKYIARLAALAADAVRAAAQAGMFFPALEAELGIEDGLTRHIAEMAREPERAEARPPEGLDAAWAAVVAALPLAGWADSDGRWVIPFGTWNVRIGYFPEDGNGVTEPHYPEAFEAIAEVDPHHRFIGDTAATPAAALLALAARLSAGGATKP